jgi:hypothetical protein
MATIKVGVREFRERLASFLESDIPVAVTKHSETLGIYVPTRRKRPKSADLSDLRAAEDRLAKALMDAHEEQLVTEFKMQEVLLDAIGTTMGKRRLGVEASRSQLIATAIRNFIEECREEEDLREAIDEKRARRPAEKKPKDAS